MRGNPIKNKLFWGWMALEVAGAVWFGWAIASAETKPWARRTRRRKK